MSTSKVYFYIIVNVYFYIYIYVKHLCLHL